MKLLFITCWYPHTGYPNRGLFIREHARAAARWGCDVKVLHLWVEYSSSSLWRVEERHTAEEGVECHSFVIHSRMQRYIYGNTPLMRFLGVHYLNKAILPEFTPNIVQGNVIYQAGMIAQKVADYLGKPYLIAEHWSKLEWYFGNRLLSYGAKKAYMEADKLLPVSDYLCRNIKTHLDGIADMKVVPNVVDNECFYYKPRAGEEDRIELLMVMNFQNTQKRPELLLKALAALPEPMQLKFRLTMIGRGNGIVESESYHKELSLRTQVRYLGELSKSGVGDEMRKSDYLMHPTEMETFGIVVAEALCCGLPCIVSRVGALPEHVESRSGRLLENNLPDWRETLRELAIRQPEYDRSSIATRHARRYTFESVGRELGDVYKEVTLSSR